MRIVRFSGQAGTGNFSYDLSVEDDATQEEITEEIADILEVENIVPVGTVEVSPVVSTFWGEFED